MELEFELKLSDVIYGCERGAWLDGAVFQSDKGGQVIFRKNKFEFYSNVDYLENWGFVKYVD